MIFCATPPVNGNLSRYYKHAADFCHKLPPNVSMEEGALLEPLSVGVHACLRAGVGPGSEVLILGAGPIGLVTLLTAKAMGATKILITDMIQGRLDMAKELGATHTLLVSRDLDEKTIVKKIHEVMETVPSKTIECCGGETTSRLAILVGVLFVFFDILTFLTFAYSSCTIKGYEIWWMCRNSWNGSG